MYVKLAPSKGQRQAPESPLTAGPSMLDTDSPLHKSYTSVILFAKIKRKEFADEVFTLNYLSKIDELR